MTALLRRAGGRKNFSPGALTIFQWPCASLFIAYIPCSLYLARGFVNVFTSSLHRISNGAYISLLQCSRGLRPRRASNLEHQGNTTGKGRIVSRHCPVIYFTLRIFSNETNLFLFHSATTVTMLVIRRIIQGPVVRSTAHLDFYVCRAVVLHM